jgi:hypothetical protein
MATYGTPAYQNGWPSTMQAALYYNRKRRRKRMGGAGAHTNSFITSDNKNFVTSDNDDLIVQGT